MASVRPSVRVLDGHDSQLAGELAVRSGDVQVMTGILLHWLPVESPRDEHDVCSNASERHARPSSDNLV